MNLFIIVLVIAAGLRLFGIAWDQGYHLHPDERMLIMVADQIRFFSQLNPNFFNYGSLPLYLLKGVGQLLDFFLFTNIANYQGLLYLGRTLSVLADIGVIVFIYKICLLLFTLRAERSVVEKFSTSSNSIGLAASFLYAITFFPIQNTHFFVVDVFLNLFATALVYFLLRYIQEENWKTVVYMALAAGAALATKVTAVVLLPVIVTVLLVRSRNKFGITIYGFGMTMLFGALTLLFHFAFMPYAYISYERFLNDVLYQTKMSSDPYIFPYTLQYVGTAPYIYYLKNIFFWGLGPVISLMSLFGIYSVMLNLIQHLVKTRSRIKSGMTDFLPIIVFCLFYLFYFIVIGRSAVKFMRYMLLMYPFFCVFAGYGLYALRRCSYRIAGLAVALIWTFLFVSIYAKPHTRIAADEWIHKNIPTGSTIAVEHWDDRLPLSGSEYYTIEELTLYDMPDDQFKWSRMKEKLKKADYIIIASNRLYIPLQRLTDCNAYRACYPLTAQYYKDLFSGKLNFKKVAEFSAYPFIKDDTADESFTVYDHPKIMIFQKK
jgi:hypothetical protein